MKKLFVLSILFFISTSIFAQSTLRKGTYAVGGNISFSNYSESSNSGSLSYFIFAPNLGYFFVNNFYTGLSLQYTHYSSSGDFSNSLYGLGPAIRYYFSNNNLKPFLGLNYTYSKTTESNTDDYNSQSDFTVSGGINYFVTNYFALEGKISYGFLSNNFSSTSNSITSTSKLLNISIGANYFIN